MNKFFKTLSLAALFLPMLTSWAGEGVSVAPIQQSIYIATSHTLLNEYVGGELLLTQDLIILARAKRGAENTTFKIVRRETDAFDRAITFGVQVPNAESLSNSLLPSIAIIASPFRGKDPLHDRSIEKRRASFPTNF